MTTTTRIMFAVLLVAAAHAIAATPPRAGDAVPAIREGRWADARAILEPVVAANPYDGRARYYLGLACQGLDDNHEAVAQLGAALDLGVTGNRRGMRQAHVAMAQSLCALGQNDLALDHLETAWGRWGFDGLSDLFEDEAFSPLHDDPRLRALAGLDAQADAGDRNARWRADLRYLRRLLIAAHPEPFHSIDAASWNAAADELEGQIGVLSDMEVTAGFMRLLASIDDGHTAVYPPTAGERAWHLLPFFPVRLADGWFVAAAAPQYAELVGGRLVEAAGRDWQDVVDFAAAHVAHDNEFTRRWLAAIALQFAEVYALASGSEDGGAVELVVERADGGRARASMAAQPVTRNPNSHWAPGDWATAYAAAPLWLRNPDENFHHELVDTGVVYARVLQLIDGQQQSLAGYGRTLREFITTSGARTLILDLRLNNGGNANEARGLVDELIRTPALGAPGALRVLIGPRSFSATAYLLGMLQKHLDPLFVGWPTGCRPVAYSSERPFRLPYSGLTGSISCELRVDGFGTDDVRPAFFPDVVVWPSGNDLRTSRDPVLEAALDAVH